MRIELIAFTGRGRACMQRLAARLREQGDEAGCAPEDTPLRSWTAAHFDTADALVFVGAAGIAVRAIAPHLRSKLTDPAVVALDENARFVIPLLSGHVGGANELALRIATLTGAQAAVTTATDGRGLFAVDSWAARQGLRICEPARIKTVSAALLAGGRVALRSDFPLEGPLPDGVSLWHEGERADIWITRSTASKDGALRLVPPVFTLGVGCRRGTPAEAIEALLAQCGIEPLCLREVCTIEHKAQEPGLLAFCRSHRLPLRAFSTGRLREQPGQFTASAFVERTVGVDNVCERSAVAGSGCALCLRKQAGGGVTVALAGPALKFRFDGEELQ